MSNGKVVVVLLVLAAVFGAWLGPAGERVDQTAGPLEAFFKHAIRTAGKPERVYLSVAGKDPAPTLLARFAGEIYPLSQLRHEGRWCSIEVTRLEWKRGQEAARCEGKRVYETLATEMHRGARGQWVVDRAESYDGERWVPVQP